MLSPGLHTGVQPVTLTPQLEADMNNGVKFASCSKVHWKELICLMNWFLFLFFFIPGKEAHMRYPTQGIGCRRGHNIPVPTPCSSLALQMIQWHSRGHRHQCWCAVSASLPAAASRCQSGLRPGDDLCPTCFRTPCDSNMGQFPLLFSAVPSQPILNKTALFFNPQVPRY